MYIDDLYKSFTNADRAIKTAMGAVRLLHPEQVANTRNSATKNCQRAPK